MRPSREAPRRQTEEPSPEAGAPALRRGIIFAAVVVVLIGVFFAWRSRRSVPSEDALLKTPASPKTPATTPSTSQRAARPFPSGPYALPPEDDADLANKRLARARHTLEGYKLGTRYPPGSRPLSEMPDLQKPHSVQPSTQPLATSDGKTTKHARVTLEQDRLYLVGDEKAQLRISCKTSDNAVPCAVLSASASSPPTLDNSVITGPFPVTFTNDAEGRAVALFAPANEGFSSYHGPIGIDVNVRIGSEQGLANFQLIYTPSAPARFTGKIREALEEGSLCLYVQMDVTKAGRYVLAGRVDDADGDGFAYLEWNDLLEAGLREAKMCIFGLLVIDQQAQSPFTLRDLEGFLLFENRDPDRELMSVIEGKVYTTKAYEASAFSSAEWQSEEKTRHLDEFENDVKKQIEQGAEP